MLKALRRLIRTLTDEWNFPNATAFGYAAVCI